MCCSSILLFSVPSELSYCRLIWQVGESLFTRSATTLIFSLMQSAEASMSASLQGFVCRCLSSHDAEQRSAVLDCILHNPEVFRVSDGLRLLVSDHNANG